MKGDAEMREALRGLINSGFARAGARVIKNVPTPDGGFEPRAFSTWCPMLLAGIGKLPDTIADRSIAIEMKRKRPDEKVSRYGLATAPIWRTGPQGGAVGDGSPRRPARWRPRQPRSNCTIARPMPGRRFSPSRTALGARWPERARKAAVELSRGEGDWISDASCCWRHPCRIRGAECRSPDRARSSSPHLVGLDDRLWPEFRSDKSITKPQVARLLKPLFISPGTIRLPDGRTRKRLLPSGVRRCLHALALPF